MHMEDKDGRQEKYIRAENIQRRFDNTILQKTSGSIDLWARAIEL